MGFLQQYLKHLLVVAQCFGVLPVAGVHSDNPTNLKFTWLSLRVVYSVCLMICSLFLLVMGIYNFWISDFQLPNLTVLIFFSNGLLVITLFLKLARDWPEFMRYWQNVEIYIKSNIVLPKLYTYILFAILGAAAVEHGLLVIFVVTSERTNSNDTNGFKQFMSRDMYVFKYIEYSWYMGAFVKFISFANTFYWNFMDVFLIAMSIALATMLELINGRIRAASEAKLLAWVDIRRYYNKLCELSFRLEEKISPIILISFSSNLYFILIQLHASVIKRDLPMESVYFFFSFGFLLLRTFAVCMFAAKIDDEGKNGIKFLCCLNVQNSESKRLLQQIASMKISLTGMNFFTVTRGLILNIAAAVVTYEIFFIQYINTINE